MSDPARTAVMKPSIVDLGPNLTEAMEIYIRLKGGNRPKTFGAAAERACKYLIDSGGNKRLL